MRALIERFYREIWDANDKTVLPQVLHEDVTFRGSLGQDKRGHAGFAEYVDFVHAALGDYHCEVEETIVEGDRAFARMTFSGVHRGDFFGFAPTGARVAWAGAAVFTRRGDRIADVWVLGDVQGLLQALEAGTDAIDLRAARESDAAAMLACVQAAYRHYIERMGKPPGPMLDDYPRAVREHIAYVAERAGEVVGVLVLVEDGDGILLDNVAVRPDCQGAGLGRRLIELAEAEARRRGHPNIDLYTHEVMTENIGMYARLGYRETERRRVKGYDRVYMRKALVD